MGAVFHAHAMRRLAPLVLVCLVACGDEEPLPAPSPGTGVLERAVESATREAEQAADLAEGAAAEAGEAARAAGQAAEAAEAVSGEAASLLAAVGFEDDRAVVQIASTRVGNLDVFVPATVVVTGGAGRRLSVYNDTEITHGVKIPGLRVEVLLPPGSETEIELPELRGGSIYDVQCPLHVPHRHGTLVVLPRR